MPKFKLILDEGTYNMVKNALFLRWLFISLCFLMFILSPVRSSIAGRQMPPTLNVVKLGLKFVADIPLPGGDSRFDYQTIDEAHRRLYISHMGANLVTVFDLVSRTVIANLRDIPGPTGILVVPELNRLYVSASTKNEVYVFDTSSLKVIAKIPTGRFPDGITFCPENKRVFVSNEFGETITVFNAITNRVVANIKMGGEVGNTHYDPLSKLIYSAVQTREELVAINPQTLKIIAHYNLPGCIGPHGFYIDSENHYAFITGEDNATYVVFDLASKRIIAKGRVGADPDVLAFDKRTHRLYVASESGVISVFDLEKRAVKKIGESFFAKNAHTVSVDEKTHLVFFPLQNVNGRPVLRVMEPIR